MLNTRFPVGGLTLVWISKVRELLELGAFKKRLCFDLIALSNSLSLVSLEPYLETNNVTECYVIGTALTNFRLYFSRCTPVSSTSTECYLGVISVEGRIPPAVSPYEFSRIPSCCSTDAILLKCKVYAIGKGVSRKDSDVVWHLSGQLGEAAHLSEIGGKVVELKIVKAVVKEGIHLG